MDHDIEKKWNTKEKIVHYVLSEVERDKTSKFTETLENKT